MKNIKCARLIQLFFLFLVINGLVATNPLVAKAQSKQLSSVTSLEGTDWAWILPIDYGMGTVQCFYKFEDQQKAIFRCVAIQGDRLQLGIDNNMLLLYGANKLTMNHLPPAVRVIEEAGKYTKNGDSFTIEFSDTTMHFTLKDNGLLSGETIYKNPNRIPHKEPWEMYRISPYPNVVSSTDGILRPASGYRWVNSKDPNDFRVEPIP